LGRYYLKLLYIGETEEELGKKKEIRYGFGADGAFREFDTACNAKFNYSQEFLNIGYKEISLQILMVLISWIKIHFTFGLENIC
jgi:hypothetical protein